MAVILRCILLFFVGAIRESPLRDGDKVKMRALSFASLRDGRFSRQAENARFAMQILRWKEYARQGTLLFCQSRMRREQAPALRVCDKLK